MKAKVTITDETGAVFEGEVDLVQVSGSAAARHADAGPSSPRRGKPTPTRSVDDDFSLPARAFMHRHGRGRSGPQAFALLVAWLAKGETVREVALEDVRREWERMTGLLGEFATVYATRAKNQAWVDNPKRGVFVLLPDWIGALGDPVS
jgi:hypothetical protein